MNIPSGNGEGQACVRMEAVVYCRFTDPDIQHYVRVLESNRSTCLIACLGFKLRAAARPWPMAQIAREPLCNTPSVASHRELTRLA